MDKDQSCEVCYKIKCSYCGWEPDEIQLSQVQSGIITTCPDCKKAP